MAQALGQADGPVLEGLDGPQGRLRGELARHLAGRVAAHAVRHQVETELGGQGVAVLVHLAAKSDVRAGHRYELHVPLSPRCPGARRSARRRLHRPAGDTT